jgi:hypothetical protein
MAIFQREFRIQNSELNRSSFCFYSNSFARTPQKTLLPLLWMRLPVRCLATDFLYFNVFARRGPRIKDCFHTIVAVCLPSRCLATLWPSTLHYIFLAVLEMSPFYRTRTFIIVFTTILYSSPLWDTWPRSHLSILLYKISFNIILPSTRKSS